MPNIHSGDAKKSQHTKVQRIVGHTDRYRHPAEKAADMAYYENQHLDPLTLPTRDKAGPMDSEKI